MPDIAASGKNLGIIIGRGATMAPNPSLQSGTKGQFQFTCTPYIVMYIKDTWANMWNRISKKTIVECEGQPGLSAHIDCLTLRTDLLWFFFLFLYESI